MTAMPVKIASVIRQIEADAAAEPALVRAARVRLQGKPQWLGMIAAPAEAACTLDPMPDANALVQAAEYHLAGCGIRGPAQITLFFDL